MRIYIFSTYLLLLAVGVEANGLKQRKYEQNVIDIVKTSVDEEQHQVMGKSITTETFTSGEASCDSTSGICTWSRVGDTDIASECVGAHNYVRQFHKDSSGNAIPQVTWNETLAQAAQDWAVYLSQIKSLKHFSGPEGENLYYSAKSYHTDLSCADAVFPWYSEGVGYDYNSPPPSSPVTGHFTQCVWKGTTQIGCGIASSVDYNVVINSNAYNFTRHYIVCRYSPAGNVGNHYIQNVLPANESSIVGTAYMMDPYDLEVSGRCFNKASNCNSYMCGTFLEEFCPTPCECSNKRDSKDRVVENDVGKRKSLSKLIKELENLLEKDSE